MAYLQQDVKRARETDLVNFIELFKGFNFKQVSGQYRCVEHPSLAIQANRQSWYWHSKSVGGHGAIDFLMNAEQLSFYHALLVLSTSVSQSLSQSVSQNTPKLMATQNQYETKADEKTLVLPEKASFLYKRAFAYLSKTRGIDAKIITALIQEKKLFEDNRGNVVFVGYDGSTPKYATKRSTNTKQQYRQDCEGSDKRFGFAMSGTNKETLYVFESAIDCMSHATIKNIDANNQNAWKEDSRLSLGGTSGAALQKYVENNKSVKNIVLCLDNDAPGRDAMDKLQIKYSEKGFNVRIEKPKHENCKDFNDDLLHIKSISTERASPEKHIKAVRDAI